VGLVHFPAKTVPAPQVRVVGGPGEVGFVYL
jgi:hypothetical protein